MLSLSRVTSWIIAAVLASTVFYFSKWEDRMVLRSDMYEYYAYLPAALIYQDLEFDFIYTTPGDEKREIPLFTAPNGGLVLKMTMGVALMEAPFFLLGHWTAKSMDVTANGYSWVYHFFMAISALFYAIWAIFLQRKLLLRYFTEGAVSLSLLAIFLGTNVFYYTTSEGAMSHVYSFFLITVFVSQSIRWIEEWKWHQALLTGLSLGLIVLIRPVNGIVVLIPLLYGVRFFAELMVRLSDIFSHYAQFALLLFTAFIAILSQLVYWHEITGEWVYYSYSNQGFFFNDPRIVEGLFGFRKGWLIYTPLGIFSLLGMFFFGFTKGASKFKRAVPVYFLAQIYIIYSWWCWWYGGGFSSRPMVEAMAILSLPMAAIFSFLLEKKYRSIGTTIAVFLLIGLNQFQSFQYREGIIHYDGMNKELYKRVWGRTTYPENYIDYLSYPDYDKALIGDRKE
jgi:hypothetical protein